MLRLKTAMFVDMNKSLVKDVAAVLLIVLGLVVLFFLFNVGMGALFLIGFVVPGWVFLVILFLVLYRKRKKQ